MQTQTSERLVCNNAELVSSIAPFVFISVHSYQYYYAQRLYVSQYSYAQRLYVSQYYYAQRLYVSQYSYAQRLYVSQFVSICILLAREIYFSNSVAPFVFLNSLTGISGVPALYAIRIPWAMVLWLLSFFFHIQ